MVTNSASSLHPVFDYFSITVRLTLTNMVAERKFSDHIVWYFDMLKWFLFFIFFISLVFGIKHI